MWGIKLVNIWKEYITVSDTYIVMQILDIIVILIPNVSKNICKNEENYIDVSIILK